MLRCLLSVVCEKIYQLLGRFSQDVHIGQIDYPEMVGLVPVEAPARDHQHLLAFRKSRANRLSSVMLNFWVYSLGNR